MSQVKWKEHLIPFLSLVFLLLLDGICHAFLKKFLTVGQADIFQRSLFIGLYYFAFRLPSRQIIFLTILLSLLMDSYYTGILGVYMTAYLIVIFLAFIIRDRADLNILSIGFYGIIIYFIFELVVYLIFNWIGFADVNLTRFLLFYFSPSLLYNTIIYLILYLPLKGILDFSGIKALHDYSL